MVRRRKFPLVGDGGGVWSFIHVADAAEATVAAIEHGCRGAYNVVDDDPAAVAEWLPALAKARCQEADPRATPRGTAACRGGRRGDDDRARRVECEGQARAGVAPGAPELAAGIRSAMTERERLLDELRPVCFGSPTGCSAASPRPRTWSRRRCYGSIRRSRQGADRIASRVRGDRHHPACDQRVPLRARSSRALCRRVAARADHHRQQRRPRPAGGDGRLAVAGDAGAARKSLARATRGPPAHHVFDYGYPEIAEMVDKSEHNVRAARHPRQTPCRAAPATVPNDHEQRDELARFFEAAEHGDLAGLETLLAYDVPLTGDGGGKVPALARTLNGRNRVARTLINRIRQAPAFRACRCGQWRSTAGREPSTRRTAAADRRDGARYRWRPDHRHQLDRQPRQAGTPRASRRRQLATEVGEMNSGVVPPVLFMQPGTSPLKNRGCCRSGWPMRR